MCCHPSRDQITDFLQLDIARLIVVCHYQNKNWGGLELITFLAQYGFGIEKTYTFTHLEVFTFCPLKQTLSLLQQKQWTLLITGR